MPPRRAETKRIVSKKALHSQPCRATPTVNSQPRHVNAAPSELNVGKSCESGQNNRKKRHAPRTSSSSTLSSPRRIIGQNTPATVRKTGTASENHGSMNWDVENEDSQYTDATHNWNSYIMTLNKENSKQEEEK